MPTIKELTAKNRELRQKNSELKQMVRVLSEDVSFHVQTAVELHKAISGFARPAYGTYLQLAERMGKRDAEIIDISIQVGLLRRVRELAVGKVGIMADPGAKMEGEAVTVPPMDESVGDSVTTTTEDDDEEDHND